MALSRWIFVRHGQSVANVERWLSGHVDTPLTDEGRAQARRARVELDAVPLGRAFTSDLVRAHDTARILLEGREVPLTVTPSLRERECGDWACANLDELRASGEVVLLFGWESRPPGGESQADVAARVLAWLVGLDEIDGTTLVVAHGGVIRILLGLLDGVALEDIGRNRVANATPHTRELAAGRWAELAALHG